MKLANEYIHTPTVVRGLQVASLNSSAPKATWHCIVACLVAQLSYKWSHISSLMDTTPSTLMCTIILLPYDKFINQPAIYW